MPGISLQADWDAERVRRAARLAEDAGQIRRLLSIAAIYDGMSRAAAARTGRRCATGYTDSTPGALRGWSTAWRPVRRRG